MSINTNYENVNNTPIGVHRYYEYNVTAGAVDADGLTFPYGKLLNGSFPGPWIRACWGDTVHLKVNVDSGFYQGVSVHAHGLRQWTKMHMDGVPGITQCPIAPGSSFEYVWPTTQYGSSWYHSHYSLQYPDGLQGPLTIHGPSSKDYDYAPALPLILTDWNHNSAFNKSTLKPCILLGGVGDITKCYPGTTNDTEIKGPFRLSFQKGQRYLLRVINTSYRAGFTFSIDNHEMWVVSADFVPITPYNTTAIRVNIGQRYNIVVVANPINSSDANFWIRTYQSPCGSVGNLGPKYMNTGIISYDNSTGPDPTSTQWPNAQSKECKDEPLLSIQPIVPWSPPGPSNSDVPRVIFSGTPPPGLPKLFYAISSSYSDFQPLQIQWGNPTFTNLQNTNWPNLSVIVPEDFSPDFNNVTSFTSKWIYLNIQSDDRDHPIHLHGHDFAIFNLTYSDNSVEPWGPSVPRRDVFTVPSGGFATIAFPADNPGAWLLHCHIAGHASSGLDLQVLEDQVAANSIWPKGTSPALATASSLCTSWSSWCTTHPTACVETDSGV